MNRGVDILFAASPFPIGHKDKVIAGCLHHIPSVCKNCPTRSCIETTHNPQWIHLVCAESGMSYYQGEFLDERFSIFGIIVVDKNTKVGGERRKALIRNWTEDAKIQSFKIISESLSVQVKEFAATQTQTNLAFLHEIRSSVGVVRGACEKLIRTDVGHDLSEKIEQAEPPVKNLFHAISLLNEQLELTDVLANPESITYGRRYKSDINGCFYKMVKLFESKADRRGIRILFYGTDAFTVSLYSSFQRIPMILLDNAVKYSYAGKTIYVNISATQNNVNVRISSFGDIVPPDFREKIFDKFFRGPNATQQSAEGMGLGLFIARQIAFAHGFSLYYETSATNTTVGNNEFVLQIPWEH